MRVSRLMKFGRLRFIIPADRTVITVTALAMLLSVCAALSIAQAPAPPDAGRSTGDTADKKFIPPPPRLIPQPELMPPQHPVEDIQAGVPRAAMNDLQRVQISLGRTPQGIAPLPLWSAIRAIVGFVALLTLAYIVGRRRIQALEQRLSIAQFMTTGLPFALLGLGASLPQIGILTPAVLSEISPILPLGLGWIGFILGSRFSPRRLDRLPEGTTEAVFGATAISIGIVLIGSATAISFLRHQTWNAEVIRDAFLLAIAGAVTGRTAPGFLQALAPRRLVPERLTRIVELEQLLGIVGILFISAYYRPQGLTVSWQLPGTAWLFLTVGIGTAMGVFVYAIFGRINKGPQFAAALIGSAAFMSGMASYLRISPLSVGFITGAVSFGIGGKWKPEVTGVFARLERPIYFVFMIIAGAVWHPWQWQGWVLMMFFVATRTLANFASSWALGKWAVRDLSQIERRALTAAPMGALSVAIVISAQDLYSGTTVPWIVTALIMGALVNEMGLQIAMRTLWRTEPAPLKADCQASY